MEFDQTWTLIEGSMMLMPQNHSCCELQKHIELCMMDWDNKPTKEVGLITRKHTNGNIIFQFWSILQRYINQIQSINVLFQLSPWSMLTLIVQAPKDIEFFYGICQLCCIRHESTFQLLTLECDLISTNLDNLVYLTLDRRYKCTL